MALRTPLYDVHVRSGARMVEFAGWDMPVQYAGILEEHQAVRTRVGLFDVSHMGEVVFRGPRALETLNRAFSNDLTRIADGQAQYGCLCRESGGVVDDVVIYRRSAQDLLVCVNAANRQKDFEWLRDGARGQAEVANESDDWAQLALQGPRARIVMAQLSRTDLASLKPFRFLNGEVAGVACTIARTGYTGEDGFELFCPPGQAQKLWEALMETGASEEIAPCGLGARDSLRLEVAYRLYGSDMDDSTTPLEAGLAWVVKLEKDDFVGKAALLAQKQKGLPRKLVGFALTDPGIARHGYDVLGAGTKVGSVTSGTRSPTLKISIGLAYVPPALAAEGTTFAVDIRGRAAAAKVVKTPFYTRT